MAHLVMFKELLMLAYPYVLTPPTRRLNSSSDGRKVVIISRQKVEHFYSREHNEEI